MRDDSAPDEEYDDGETNESKVFTRLCGRGRFKVDNRVGCV